MTIPKMKPCAKCQTDAGLAVFKYDHGGQHVECVRCNYLGPCAGSVLWAVRLHNKRAVEDAALLAASVGEANPPKAGS